MKKGKWKEIVRIFFSIIKEIFRNEKDFVRRNVAVGLLLAMMNSFVFADIKLDRNANQNTSIDRAQNNQAVIININTPNSKGISVNDFENFQTKEGVVLNNFGSGVGRSYLAGMMASNPNLSKEQAARLILNRVGGNNRVEIENWLEVMSHDKTDVLFSSTNGFYLNNTGFINFDKVMFTTSRVDLDVNGNLLPFNVRSGNISIGRDGINAEGVRYLALLSKSINVDGQINAKDAEVNLIAGNFDYNPETKEYTKQGPGSNELLISATNYGSIYSNILIVASNGDVGVKGDLISERVLKINADGTVVTNRTQAGESIDIKAKEYVQEGSTYSEGKVRIEADKTTLKGTGTQTGELEVTGNLESDTTVYSKGNVTVGGDVKSKGQLLSEGTLEVKGNLESENLVYGKDEIKVGKNLQNKSDLQSENDININGDVNNSGKILADRNLNIKGNTVNQGTLYGKDSIKIEKNLNNTGNIQISGDLSAKDTVNKGTIIAESNITTENLDNSGEILTNEKLSTKNLDNRTSGRINTGNGISTSGNISNQGTMNTNGDLTVNGNFENNNVVNAGGTLTAKDINNNGTLKVSDRIVSRGVTFTNSGEILTENLDVDVSENVTNSNKLIVLDNAKIKGNSIANHNYISATNMELITTSLLNNGTLAADEVLKANNAFINNAGGYIGSNQKVELNNTNLTNSGTIESAVLSMENLSGYGNTGLIRGNSVVLTSGGNLTLSGTLHGEDYLQINGLDIQNYGVTTGTGYIEIKGRDITNNTVLASEIIVVEGTGTVVNNSMITGENGRITGYSIVNNDLIAFSDQLGLKATDKIINNKSIEPDKRNVLYGGELLDIEFNTLENLSGELLSTGLINLKGNYLLNQTGMIQSSEDISIDVTKVDNIGSVADLDKYEIYYETWDGQIYDQAYVESGVNKWLMYFTGGDHSGRGKRVDQLNGQALQSANQGYNLYLWTVFPDVKTRVSQDNSGDLKSTSTQYAGAIPLKGKLRSKAVTTFSSISAGNNISITANELNNKDGKISAGKTADITAGTIKNETTLGNKIQLQDGHEHISYKRVSCGTLGSKKCYPVTYRRYFELGDEVYITGQASVIEAGNLVINTGSLILTPEIDHDSQIITGSTTSGGLVNEKTLNKGSSEGTGIIIIAKNMDPMLEIKTTGVLPINPLAAQSSLFSMSKDPTSKYLLETRSQYINLGNFYGSDYYLSRIGYDENSDWNKARRLGDAYYEYLLVTRTISEKLGTRFINGLSDSDLMKAMLDNSVELQKDLQLTVGVALTADQVKALKSDVIWYEYEVVNGEKVLVPKVYLSQATLATIETDGRNKIGGLELTAINADELRNNGQLIGNGGVTYVNAGRVYNVTNTNELSEIRGNEVTVVATAGNIENIGGRIKGIESVALVAENGDIVNSSSTRKVSYNHGDLNRTEHDEILSIGSIESQGTTYIEGKSYISEAGKVSGATTVIDAKENITIGSLTLKGDDKFGSDSNNYEIYQSTRKVGSEISGTENVILNAGKDITLKGSIVGSDGTVQMTAENINILNEKESEYRERKEKTGNALSNYSMEEKSYQEYAAGSTVVGNNIILDAANDINVRASNLIAVKGGLENTGGNISMVAGNNVNILVDTLDNSYSFKEKKSGFSTDMASGGGNFTAGVSYSQSSLEQQRNGTTAAVSTIISEGSTVIDAGNRVRTEAMQANIGENLVIRGTNGVELLDAKEVYEEKIKQKTTTVGVSVNVGFTPAQLANTVSNVADNAKDYGFGNTSQSINTIGNGISDLRSVAGLSGNLRSWYETTGYISAKDIFQKGDLSPDNLRDAAKGLVSASASLNFSQSSYESNTSGTNSVAGNINVGKNFVIESEGDVKLVNQRINVGENFIVDAKSFEARAGENTYNNSTKSSSVGGSVGYDMVNQNVIGGLNVSGGNSNTSSKYYDNTVINAGATFQLTTKEDALFAGVNVTADKINFDIGRNLSIISLQDEYKSDGKNYGAGISVSGKIPGTEKQTGSPIPTLSGNYGENHQDSKWVNNQTSIIAENGGNIKVGETLTNIGAVIGSLSDQNKLSIEANKIVVENLKDHNEGENYGIGLSGVGIGKDNKTPIGQTSVQYGSHDKQQDSNATFVNTEVTEAGKKLNLEELGINTDISKAQVVTKDEVVEQIDTVLHTDLLNETTRNQFIKDVNGLVQLPGDIIKAISITSTVEESNFLDNLVGTLRSTDANLIKYQEMNKKYQELKKLPEDERATEALKLVNEMANTLRGVNGIDDDVKIVINFTDQPKDDEMGSFVKEDGKIEIYLNVKNVDVSDMEQVYNVIASELNHYNPSNPYVYDKKENEIGKTGKLHELEEMFTLIGRKPLDGEGNSFYGDILDGSLALNYGNSLYGEYSDEDLDYLVHGLVKGACNGLGIMGACKKAKDVAVKAVDSTGLGTPARAIYDLDKKILNGTGEKVGEAAGKTVKEEVKKGKEVIITINKEKESQNKKNNNTSNKIVEKTCDSACYAEELNKNYYYNPLNAIMEEKNQEMSNYYNPSYYLTNLDYEKLFTDTVNDLSKRPTSELFGIVHTDAVNNNKIVPGFNTKQNLADLQEQEINTELYNIYDSVRPGGITLEEADRLSKRIGVAQKASIVRDELEAPLLVTLFTQLGYDAYNKKYGLTDVGGGIQVVGKYAPEVVARDVTNSASSNNYSNTGLLPYTPSNSGLIAYTPPYAGLLTYTSAPKSIFELYGLNLQLFAEKTDVASGPRYGERKISNEEYKELRTLTPTKEIRKIVNEDLPNILGKEDFALPGKIIDKPLQADHIVPMNNIVKMDGFNTLTFDQKLQVLNNIENFTGLSEAANKSKGAKSYVDWEVYKKENIAVDFQFRIKMIEVEKQMETQIQKQIDDFNRQNK